MSEHERPVEPFSDLHVEEGRVRATLLHDPTVEGLDMALYLDGSGSMRDEYEAQTRKTGGGFFWDLLGWGSPPKVETLPNQVEPHARWILEYLATKDRNGQLRVAYWACGSDGRKVEVLGELKGSQASGYTFSGPRHHGNHTIMCPAIQDYIAYFHEQRQQGARQGCMVIITDGEVHDAEEVKRMSANIARRIAAGDLPRINFILVGVGEQINEEQLEEICHQEYPGVGHLWCHRIAAEIKNIPELVAALVDETMTVASGGTIYDDKGRVLKVYEGRLPAVLEFQVPEGCEAFTLEVGGNRYTQPIPEEHHDEDEDEDHH